MTTTIYRCPTCQARAPLSQFQSVSDAYYYCHNCKNVIVPIPDSPMRHAKPSTANLYRGACGHIAQEAHWKLDGDELYFCPVCSNLTAIAAYKPKKPPTRKRSRLKPMSTDTRKRYEANKGWRARFVKEVGCCQNPQCNTPAWKYLLHVHEIPNGPGRKKATAHRDCCLVLCDYCNANIFTDKALWPVERQCALKLLTDPLFFNLPLINELRGRAPSAITISDLAPFLELKR